jgi:hypothetical protein
VGIEIPASANLPVDNAQNNGRSAFNETSAMEIGHNLIFRCNK